jgi:hypothetical protein
MHFGTMAEWLESAKLTFACSAHYLDSVEAVNLTPEQQAFLKDIHDPMFKQTVRDFMVNQQFRKDYWVKGARKMSTLEQAEALRTQKVILTTPRDDVILKISGALGEASLDVSVYLPILNLLADHKTKTLGQIEQALKDEGVNFAQLIQAAIVLIGAGHLGQVQDENTVAKTKKQADKLNAYLCQKARSSNELSFLASPVTGGGFGVNRFQQMFLFSIGQGKKQASELADFVWQLLSVQGQKLLKEGKTLQTPEENLSELTSQAQAFLDKSLPILKALQIA